MFLSQNKSLANFVCKRFYLYPPQKNCNFFESMLRLKLQREDNMNEIWQETLRQSKNRIEEKKRRRKKYTDVLKKGALVLLCLHLIFPQYAKRIIYPYLIGQPTTEQLQISAEDMFEDIEAASFRFERKNHTYILVPRTKYAVTGRIGIIEHYDTLFNIFYRGQFQGDYIALVPRDIVLVIGQMATPKVFNMLEFEHEERLGRVLCKGVKYQKSFMPSFMSTKKAQENWQKYQQCNSYINSADYDNYHPIPANERINKALSMLMKGDVVHLEGILVDVPQMRLKTGTRKNQTHSNIIIGGYQPGMCFILYTTKVILNNRVYE